MADSNTKAQIHRKIQKLNPALNHLSSRMYHFLGVSSIFPFFLMISRFERFAGASASIFLPWFGMFLKMTIFGTKVVVTHITKNRIILSLLAASSTG
ncbi:MAG: hypothetical protein M3P08_19335 [Thermoproteota archaeon]|nr:hypothetical protein [Thermoproteota archaeon]